VCLHLHLSGLRLGVFAVSVGLI